MNLASADLANFQRLGIPAELLSSARVSRVDDREAEEAYGIRYAGNKCGVVFPYHMHGQRVTARLRRDNPEVDRDGKPLNKYLSAFGDRRHLYFPRAF